MSSVTIPTGSRPLGTINGFPLCPGTQLGSAGFKSVSLNPFQQATHGLHPQNSRVLNDLLKGQVPWHMPKVAVTVTQEAEAGRSVV